MKTDKKPLILKKKARKGKGPNMLEKKFKMILTLLGLIENKDYKFQYEFKGKLFDFYLIKENVIIEVDGDFFHCNENKFEPKYDIQKATISNDKIKNQLCIDNDTKLCRFWEKDINERPEWIISELRKVIKKFKPK